MKKLILIIVVAFATLAAAAQQHLSFKGIPIEGSMDSFCQKLQAKGFTKLGSDNNITLFDGDFTGRHAIIGVGASNDGKNVHSVAVVFDASSEWNTLVKTYDYYKDLYTRKYGKPSVSKELNKSTSEENVMIMIDLSEGKVTYGSAWEVHGGHIELSIEKANIFGSGAVVVKYRDAQNVEAKIQQDLDEI